MWGTTITVIKNADIVGLLLLTRVRRTRAPDEAAPHEDDALAAPELRALPKDGDLCEWVIGDAPNYSSYTLLSHV